MTEEDIKCYKWDSVYEWLHDRSKSYNESMLRAALSLVAERCDPERTQVKYCDGEDINSEELMAMLPESKLGYIVSQMLCSLCGYTYVAVMPVGTRLPGECPSCGEMSTLMRGD